MGYYKCPRCGSEDSYSGTEHVLQEDAGKHFTMINEVGVAMTRKVGGGSRQKEITVRKCRDCGEILGQKDYYLTEEEIESIEKEAAAKAEAEKEYQKLSWVKIFTGFIRYGRHRCKLMYNYMINIILFRK